MNRVSTIICGLSVALLIAGAASAETAQENFERSYAFTAGQRLSLENTNGDISIEAWDGDEIRVQATKRVKARGGSADELLRELRIEVEVDARGVAIETVYPRRNGLFGWNNVSASVEYRVQVPRQADLELRTVNGEIDVSEVAGEIRVRSTNGDVSVTDSAGSVNASTTNGAIDVELDQVSGSRMEFETTNGGIRVYLPATIRASVLARTTNGSIETDFPVAVQGEFRRTRLEGDINGGGPQIELRTTNGSIRIRER